MEKKRCPRGHTYDENLPECPVCREKSYVESEIIEKDKKKTVKEEKDKTIREEPESKKPDGYLKKDEKRHTPSLAPKDHTQVLAGEEKIVEKEPKRARRKLVGWIVTYSLEKNGISFELYEGKNIIGRGEKNDIIIPETVVSEQHTTILYKPEPGKFYLKDLGSSNGTKLNSEELEPDQSKELKDGDKITIAKVFEFYFRTCIPPGNV